MACDLIDHVEKYIVNPEWKDEYYIIEVNFRDEEFIEMIENKFYGYQYRMWLTTTPYQPTITKVTKEEFYKKDEDEL